MGGAWDIGGAFMRPTSLDLTCANADVTTNVAKTNAPMPACFVELVFQIGRPVRKTPSSQHGYIDRIDVRLRLSSDARRPFRVARIQDPLCCRYSALIPAALMIGHHVAISAW